MTFGADVNYSAKTGGVTSRASRFMSSDTNSTSHARGQSHSQSINDRMAADQKHEEGVSPGM
jgi:hypothetical protein